MTKRSQASTDRAFDERLSRHLKTFDDPVIIDRAWNRLARTNGLGPGSRVQRARPLLRVMSSAALVCVGVLCGMYLERSMQAEPQFTVRSEVLAPSAHSAAMSSPQGEHRAPNRAAGGSELQRPHERSSARSQIPLRRLLAKSAAATPTEKANEAAQDAAPVDAPVVVVPAKAEWTLLAERGDFAGAFQKLDEMGGFDQALLVAGPDELMTLADVARAVGRQGRAIQALRIVVDQYREDENAPLAAMMLGNLLSRTGDSDAAAEAFALNRRLSPGGDFAEDALVREFDMAMAARDLPEAERLRAQYVREYPQGRHQEVLRAELDRLAAELAPGDASKAYDENPEETPDEEAEGEGERDGDVEPVEAASPKDVPVVGATSR